MLKYFRPKVLSRHPSHDFLRRKHKEFPLFPFKSVIRFGSTTEADPRRVEINSIEAVKNSSSKLRMKTRFLENDVKTADWWIFNTADNNFRNVITSEDNIIDDLPFPIISKNIFGSRGTGNKKHDNTESLQDWLEKHPNTSNYIFEKYYNYVREYRLHVSEDGCFYACRKMLKSDAPVEDRWYRNDDHCVWIMEENELFDKPTNWDEVVAESVKALKAVGLDIGAIDLRIQSSKKGEEIRENPEFIIVEINSAPSFGEVTKLKYLEELTKLLQRKWKKNQLLMT